VERGVESYKPSGESRTADQGDVLGEAGQGELWDVNYDGESNNSLQHRKGKKNSIHKRIGVFICILYYYNIFCI